MVRNLFGSLAKRMRKILFSMNERPTKKVDEYVLEHLLLYHGLVGSSPENQRSFREVRDDINQAVRNNSSLQMSVALQVPPLWWEDKLRAIFDEIVAKEGSERAVSTLIPELSDDTWPNRVDPLGHPDWHVRANAAIILSHLQARKATGHMLKSLRDSAHNAKSAFCHIAYSLGRLGSEQSRAVLSEFLQDEEPWFCVDAAGALAQWPTAIVGDTLMSAMLSFSELADYVAVAIGRQHKPIDFLSDSHAVSRQGACAMVLAVLDASRQTFGADIASEYQLSQCLRPIIELARSEPTPLSLRAALALIDWSGQQDEDDTLPSREQRQSAADEFTTGDIISRTVLEQLQVAKSKNNGEPFQLRQAVILAGDFKVQAAVPFLVLLLEPGNALLDPTIMALAQIGEPSAIEPLLQLANKLVDLSKRTALPLSKQPVEEEDLAGSKSYWQVLKALGATYSRQSIKFLISASLDHAADKRDQALDSLVKLGARSGGQQLHLPAELKSEMLEVIIKALGDPSPAVRATALKGVEALSDAGSIPEVVNLTASAEISVSRQAFATLESLWHQGYGDAIKQAGEERMRAHAKTHWATQFADFLAVERSD